MLVGASARSIADALPSFSQASDMPFDVTGHLASHWLLLPRSCPTPSDEITLSRRLVGMADGQLASELWGSKAPTCPNAVCLQLGAPRSTLTESATFYDKSQTTDIAEWAHKHCQWVHVGFVNYLCEGMRLWWVSSGLRHEQTDLPFGESEIKYRVAGLGAPPSRMCPSLQPFLLPASLFTLAPGAWVVASFLGHDHPSRLHPRCRPQL
jgi:hypothetical protein